MTAHSRGPWFGGFDEGDKYVRICCAEHGVIARVRVDDIDRDEAMANANLVEAAPELLAAAKALAENFLRDELDDPELCVSDRHHAAIRSLFYAIAKAEGR